MVISTAELLDLYKNYKVPQMKIKHEIEKGRYIYLNRGLYETDKNVPGHLLAAYIKSPSYLSFEYALSYYGLIPESVYVYTSATTGQRHSFYYKNDFGNYSYQDIPKSAFGYDVIYIEERGYSYLIASKEKAICDYLAIREPLKNKKQLLSFLFDSLRFDYDAFMECDFEKMMSLCDLYKKGNLKLFKKVIRSNFYGKHYHQ